MTMMRLYRLSTTETMRACSSDFELVLVKSWSKLGVSSIETTPIPCTLRATMVTTPTFSQQY